MNEIRMKYLLYCHVKIGRVFSGIVSYEDVSIIFVYQQISWVEQSLIITEQINTQRRVFAVEIIIRVVEIIWIITQDLTKNLYLTESLKRICESINSVTSRFYCNMLYWLMHFQINKKFRWALYFYFCIDIVLGSTLFLQILFPKNIVITHSFSIMIFWNAHNEFIRTIQRNLNRGPVSWGLTTTFRDDIGQ